MARRRAKPKRRRSRSRGVKLIPLAASYISISAVTQTLFNNNAWTFFTTDWMGSGRGPSGGPGQGLQNMTMAEIVKGLAGGSSNGTEWNRTTLLGDKGWGTILQQNLADNWFMGTLQLVAGASLPKVMNKLPGRPVQKVNKLLKDVGIGDVVKL